MGRRLTDGRRDDGAGYEEMRRGSGRPEELISTVQDDYKLEIDRAHGAGHFGRYVNHAVKLLQIRRQSKSIYNHTAKHCETLQSETCG